MALAEPLQAGRSLHISALWTEHLRGGKESNPKKQADLKTRQCSKTICIIALQVLGLGGVLEYSKIQQCPPGHDMARQGSATRSGLLFLDTESWMEHVLHCVLLYYYYIILRPSCSLLPFRSLTAGYNTSLSPPLSLSQCAWASWVLINTY